MLREGGKEGEDDFVKKLIAGNFGGDSRTGSVSLMVSDSSAQLIRAWCGGRGQY